MVDKEKAIKLRLSGHTYSQIAEIINCSVDWCKRNLTDYKKPITVKRQREKGFAFPSIQKLVIRSGLSEKTVNRSKKSLITGGWLTIESGTGKMIMLELKDSDKYGFLWDADNLSEEDSISKAALAKYIRNRLAVLDVRYGADDGYKASEVSFAMDRLVDLCDEFGIVL